VEAFQLSPHTPDRFVWKWSSCGNYTASSAYRAFFISMTFLPGAKLIWKAAVPPKVKFFFWLALHGRLWTADRRKRHGLQPDAVCALCDQAEETTDTCSPPARSRGKFGHACSRRPANSN
jgi:hypothetical protein